MTENEGYSLTARAARGEVLQARNGFYFPARYPAEVRALLNDPRLDGLVEYPGMRHFCPLRPPVITREQSKFLQVTHGSSSPRDNARWVSPNFPHWTLGRGKGFGEINERPRIEQPKAAPRRLFHFWQFDSAFVASPDVLEILRSSCPEAISSIPIDWVFSDAQALDGYELVDVLASHDVFDYSRSVVNVEPHSGEMWISLGIDLALREDIPADARLFRDSLFTHQVFVSRDLAAEIARFANREIAFYDVQTQRHAEFPRTRLPRSLKAKLRKEQWPTDDPSLPLARRIHIRVIPLLRSGHIAKAEALLTDWMRALPRTSFHVIADLSITTPLDECADFFNGFAAKARREHKLKAVYSEMNGFAANTDQWFCDAFGLNRDGGDDSHDWLGDSSSSSDGSLIISGLGPAQAAFAQRMRNDSPSDIEASARTLAEALVVVKYQGWLQRAVPYMNIKCSFWATAHDYYEYLAKIAAA